MLKFILSWASAQIVGKALTFASIAIMFQMLPRLLSWFTQADGGYFGNDGSWTFDFLNPLSSALQFAPEGVAWMITYTYADLAITLYVSGLVWGLAKDLVVGAK